MSSKCRIDPVVRRRLATYLNHSSQGFVESDDWRSNIVQDVKSPKRGIEVQLRRKTTGLFPTGKLFCITKINAPFRHTVLLRTLQRFRSSMVAIDIFDLLPAQVLERRIIKV
jgi:hypothetical protein